jgi:hypothetical protein
MIRGILAFLIITALLHFTIVAWQSLSGKQRWSVIKTMSYASFLSVVALVILSVMIFIF